MNAKTLYDTYAQLERISIALIQLLHDEHLSPQDKAIIKEFEQRFHALRQLLANLSAEAQSAHWDGIERRQKPS